MSIIAKLLSDMRRLLRRESRASSDAIAQSAVYAASDGEPASHPTVTTNELEFSWRHGYFFACLNKISTSAMGVPLCIMRLHPRGGGSSRQRYLTRSDVRRVRLGISSVPWDQREEWVKEKGFDLEEVEADHDIVKLLDRPNRHTTWPEFIQLSMLHLVGSGDCYWELVGGESQGKPSALYVMQPDRVKVIGDAREWVRGYQYEVNWERVELGRDEVLHFRLPHPMNDHYGLSRADSLQLQLDTDYKRLIYNHRFFKVGARLGKLLTPKEGVELDAASAQRAVDEFRSHHQGVENMGKICYFGVPVDITETEAKPKDMEFGEMKEQHEYDISAVTGVPRALTGRVEDANRSNLEMLSTLFWDTTMIPLMKVFCAKINTELTPRYDERIVVRPDFSVVHALSEETSSKSERVVAQLEAGAITVNEARSQLGFDPLPDGDVLKVGSDSKFVPLSDNGTE